MMMMMMTMPIALETLDPINESAEQFLNDLGHRITSLSRWQGGDIPIPTILCRSAEIHHHLTARVVWDGIDDDPDL